MKSVTLTEKYDANARYKTLPEAKQTQAIDSMSPVISATEMKTDLLSDISPGGTNCISCKIGHYKTPLGQSHQN